MQLPPWKEILRGQVPDAWNQELDAYENQLALKRMGRLEDKVFAETRLRRGAYGQRYDSGRRHDGQESRNLGFDESKTKGPDTLWDAPGMQRIKIPGGRLTPRQLEVLCDLAEEYSDHILHVTTRQDIQLHYVHIDDTPDLMRRLAAVGITTREACGNSVRNVTACHVAGVCGMEAFDVSPYARALAFFLLGHPGTQDLGRKFKVSFSGCQTPACGLAGFHDIGCIAQIRETNGEQERGFALYVGGGLGPVPHAAELLDPFVPARELLPMALAVCRVFSAKGERANRARARMKFVLMNSGIEQFRLWVEEARAALEPDPRWETLVSELEAPPEPLRPPGDELPPHPRGTFLGDNVQPQKQAGYSTVTVKLPLGDFTPAQGRALANLARRFTSDDLRTTVEQNILFRWVSNTDVGELYDELAALGLAESGASGITDVTSCPGTDTCKLGISSSRGLARELRKQLQVADVAQSEDLGGLHIKCSGCFNSCGQHHVADLGFLGVSRAVGGRRVPHFQMVVGGSWENNGSKFGLAIGAIPSKRVPEALSLVTAAYRQEKQGDETFAAWVHRVGRKHVKELLSSVTQVPPYDAAPELYRDWGDPRTYSIGDIGTGECAGEVISPSQFAFAESERLIFEAQLSLDEEQHGKAHALSLAAMHAAARAVCLELSPGLKEDPTAIGETFDRLLGKTGRFDAAFPGGNFSRYFEQARKKQELQLPSAEVRKLLDEAQMFIDAAHEYESKRGDLAPRTPTQEVTVAL